MKRKAALILALVMVIGLLAGCGQGGNVDTTAANSGTSGTASSDSADTEKKTYKLGTLALDTLGSPVFVSSMNALRDMCATAGVELIETPMTGYDDAAFMSMYEAMIDQGCDGVIVYTFSEGTIGLIADMFEEAGVDWFLANRQISDPDLKEQVFSMDSLVGNCYCSEEENAYEMIRQLKEDYGVENLAVIGLTQGDLNGDLRDKGIARACEDFGVTLLTETRGITTVDDVTNSVEGIIASYPEVDGIFIVGGQITTGALAGAAQALSNHDMSDKVSIAMVDISAGMGEYMGEGKPLKMVVGGNLIMDFLFSGASLINHFEGVNTGVEPYVINTRMMYIYDSQTADDYDEYCENATIPILSGEAWRETLLGKSVEEMQKFSDDFSVAYAKQLR